MVAAGTAWVVVVHWLVDSIVFGVVGHCRWIWWVVAGVDTAVLPRSQVAVKVWQSVVIID